MKKVTSLILLNILFNFSLFSQSNYLRPELKIVDNKAIIQFRTSEITARAGLAYSERNDNSSIPFPDYYNQLKDNNADSIHIFKLNKINYNSIYDYRVFCTSKENLNQIRSINYSFKILNNNGILSEGIVFTEKPVISCVTNNSASISWKTNLPAEGIVEYSDDAKNIQTIKCNLNNDQYEVSLKNLKADKVYKFKIKISGSNDSFESDKLTFKTAPNGFKPFTFAVMSDSRGGNELDPDARLNGVNYLVLNKFSHEIIKKGADFALFSGDLIGGFGKSIEDVKLQYSTWKQAVSELTVHAPVYSTLGNHDASGYQILKDSILGDPPSPFSNEDLFKNEFILPENGPENEPGYPTYSENVYSFNYGDVHFIALNSDYYYCYIPKKKIIDDPYAAQIDRRQRKWLKEDLEKNKDKRIVVFYHSPAYPAGGHIGNYLDRLPAVRDSVIIILNQYNVKMIFNGHEHNYSRTRIDNSINKKFNRTIYQFITGRTGAPSYTIDKNNPFLKNVEKFSRSNHYALVKVDKKNINVKIIDDKDEIIDEINIK